MVKEVQLSPRIDPHDLGIKVSHAVGFLCEDMKVKVALKFRGREMAHTEIGFEVIKKFLDEIAPYGHPDFQPKLIGRGINVMISPLPRNKRAKKPETLESSHPPAPADNPPDAGSEKIKVAAPTEPPSGGFSKQSVRQYRRCHDAAPAGIHDRAGISSSPAAHQFRKPAVIADRVRVPAKIADDLHQALLRRRAC